MTVHFVGAGPGAADLLTLRAARLLGETPVCVYAGTYVDPDVLALCPDDARRVDTQHLDLDAITAVLVEADAAGQDVVRLCSGDPSVYSALAEQTRRLDRAGVAWDVVPGVPAYAAAAALVGAELTVPEVAQTVVLTRAQARSTAMPESEALPRVAAIGGTVCLHLAITRVRELADVLRAEHGDDCPVVVVHRATQPDEQVLVGTLTTIADAVEAAGLRQAAVVLVGRALASSHRVAEALADAGVAFRDRGAESHLYDPARPRSRPHPTR